MKLISVARVGSPVNDMRAKLGNHVAIKAYREGKLPFPDGDNPRAGTYFVEKGQPVVTVVK